MRHSKDFHIQNVYKLKNLLKHIGLKIQEQYSPNKLILTITVNLFSKELLNKFVKII